MKKTEILLKKTNHFLDLLFALFVLIWIISERELYIILHQK